MIRALMIVLGLTLAACPGTSYKRTYPSPKPDEVLEHLVKHHERVKSLNAETLSDVRIGKDRANVKVYMLAKWGGKLRFAAITPNDMTAAELASDGANFCFLDAQKNCGDCGPATPENVAQLVRIELPPDEVVKVLLGGAPVIGNAKATLRWDDASGREILELSNGELTERIELDGRDRRWDVLKAEVKGKDGKLVWRIQHKDYHDVGGVRMPGKSYYEGPKDDALIQWKEQKINEELEDGKFEMTLPPGLPPC